MSYTPTIWKRGDIVSSEKLNKLEQGLADATSEEVIKEETDDWLEENVAQETGYVLDRSLSMSNAAAPADKVGELKTALTKQSEAIDLITPTLRNGTITNPSNANAISSQYVLASKGAKKVKITINKPKIDGNTYLLSFATFSQSGGASSASTYRLYYADPYLYTKSNFWIIDLEQIDNFAFSIFEYDTDKNYVSLRIATLGNCITVQYIYETDNKIIPSISNGSLGNTSNPNYVRNNMVIPLPQNVKSIVVNLKNTTGENITWNTYGLWFYNTINISSASPAKRVTYIDDANLNGNSRIEIQGELIRPEAKSFALTISATLNNALYPLRSINLCEMMEITYYYFPNSIYNNAINFGTTRNLYNARHCNAPLTIAHFSDIHAESIPYTRILNYIEQYNIVDDIICTGDMVSNQSGSISTWWAKNVLTCIGNHDTASYSGGVYDWTALSMADRDAYYIAPFESEWGITHTSGTSYYYKDYTTQKVRLIVMDVMLYEASDQTQAATQTAWLENLLADAITNSLHVLIAIHCPHGGATALDCTFSKYNATTMPTYSDCNTPQTIIDTIGNAITSGLKFIGYICGHTHQDGIWDAENNRKQLMYCVTSAATSVANTWNSDQDRTHEEDAFNLITIDTENTLVKIIRGGGADIDNRMRTRKAICFNYSTGEKVGEVL